MEKIIKYFSHLTQTQIQQFASLKDLYDEWNKKINVISRKDIENFYEHHVLHSLSIALKFTFPPGHHIMDLGCGGGFPGIPLAIFFPNVQFYMVDSIQKKLKVVEAVASSIGLQNILIRHARAEDLQNNPLLPAGGFDTIVSRAVAPLKDLGRWSKPLLRKGDGRNASPGGLICLKGGDLSREIAESGYRPRIWELQTMFEESFFTEKYMLQVTSL